MLPQNMRKEVITEDELMAQLRREGITVLAQVKEAYMEGDGLITAVNLNQNESATG